MKRIDEMFAFVMVDPDDDTEGIPAYRGPDGMMMPMVGADRARVESLRPIAQSVADEYGRTVSLVRYSVREELEELKPGG